MNNFNKCTSNIELMLKRSQTKVIFPIITFGLIRSYNEHKKNKFSDLEIRRCYESSVKFMKDFLKHDFHIGGKYYDAYPSRNLPKYGVLKVIENKFYELLSPFTDCSEQLVEWIPPRIKEHIDKKLGIIPNLKNRGYRVKLSESKGKFLDIIIEHINKNPTNFEILSFSIIKVHLEKFACKVYRDTRTSATDKGVDLATNFGVVYQIKKLKIDSKSKADNLYSEIKMNFAKDRIEDGNIIIIIDDISKDIKKYLIDMKIQSIATQDLLKLAKQFDDVEDREKVLRIVFEEFKREYSSDLK